MDEQFVKQKIELTESEPDSNTLSDLTESTESTSLPEDPAVQSLEGHEKTSMDQPAQSSKEDSSSSKAPVQSKTVGPVDASQAVSPSDETLNTRPSSWLAAILLFLTVHSYISIMTLYSQLIAKGGFEAWLDLVKFSGLEILGFFAFGPKQFAAHWAMMGSYHSLFMCLLVYWSLFALYPMAIVANDIFGDKKNIKGKLADAVIVLIGLACFVPFPCFSFWRNGGLKRFLGLTKTSDYDTRLAGILANVWSFKFSSILPEALSRSCEFWFNYFFVYFIFRYCMMGPMQGFRTSDLESLLVFEACLQIGIALHWCFKRNSFINIHNLTKIRSNARQLIAWFTVMSVLCVLSNCIHMFKHLNQTTMILSCVLLVTGVVACFLHRMDKDVD